MSNKQGKHARTYTNARSHNAARCLVHAVRHLKQHVSNKQERGSRDWAATGVCDMKGGECMGTVVGTHDSVLTNKEFPSAVCKCKDLERL